MFSTKLPIILTIVTIGIVGFSITVSAADSAIPEWIKNNAKWWADGMIDDESFTQGIQYLIKEKIVDIPDLPYPASWMDDSVPSWVKNNASWWADDLIPEDDFIKAIKYLGEKGIVQI